MNNIDSVLPPTRTPTRTPSRTWFMPAIMAILGSACAPDVEQPECVTFDAHVVGGVLGTIEVTVTTDQPGAATIVKLTPLLETRAGFQELASPSLSTRSSDTRGNAVHRITITSVGSNVTDIAVNACTSAQEGRYRHECPNWIRLRIR